jgi:superfamily II DNA or RNA helicase
MFGYIYIREHTSYDNYNLCKLGKTMNIPERDSQYATSEIKRGKFSYVYEVNDKQLSIIERLLQYELKEYNIRYDGGTEFYDKIITKQIINIFEKYRIEYRQLNDIDISNLMRHQRIRKILNKINIRNLINFLKTARKNNNNIIPNQHQQYVLDNIKYYYKFNNIGKIIWACGLGKSLLAVFIIKIMNFKNVIIGVPTKYLQSQIINEIIKIFPNEKNILFVGGNKNNSVNYAENIEQLLLFLNDNYLKNDCKFIITTYNSCHLIVSSGYLFDFKIGDEAHHLVGINNNVKKGFKEFHKIKSTKTLFMTATEKTINEIIHKEKYSMNDEEYFGKYIDFKSIRWAIEKNKITDYNILVLKNTEDDVNNIINSLKINVSNKELFISAYMSLKSFIKYNNLSHILIYTNTSQEAELSKKYVNDILELNILPIRINEIYNNALYSGLNIILRDEIKKFKNQLYGIISCIYIFGEGFNLPKLNGVCISSNMQSEIRIVQSLLRPNRLENGNPSKIAYIIIPYIDSNDWTNENKSYEKVRSVISHMRNSDECIEQKISILISNKNQNKKIKQNNNNFDWCWDYDEDCKELNKIKMRLRYSKTLNSNLTEEQDEFNYIRSINQLLNIDSKKKYIEYELIHSNYIKNPENYFKNKGVWTNWYDFFGVELSQFIQSKNDWINFCKEKNIFTLKDYYEKCEIYNTLPKDPGEFYSHFTNISNELKNINIKRR